MTMPHTPVSQPLGFFVCWAVLQDCTGFGCSAHAFSTPFFWSPKWGCLPTASTLALWWLKFGLAGGEGGGGGGGTEMEYVRRVTLLVYFTWAWFLDGRSLEVQSFLLLAVCVGLSWTHTMKHLPYSQYHYDCVCVCWRGGGGG